MLDTEFDAILFDMDGTLINSIPSAERVWGRWARAQGIDVEAFLPTIHGVRAVETIRKLGLAGVDPEAEALKLAQAEIADVAGIEPIAGARAFLAALPPGQWAIVTSATRDLALKRLGAAGMPVPELLLTAEDVARGKPAPDCFQMAAARLGRDARRCLVFEDAPAGIQAAEAAGAAVVVVDATHRHPMPTPHPTISSYDGLVVERRDGRLRLAREG